LELLVLSLFNLGSLVGDAGNIMDQAGNETTQIANGLFDVFHSIVNF